jgi:hypothetical protein
MKTVIPNDLNSERSVELRFVGELAETWKNKQILDVGGIPTLVKEWSPIVSKLTINNLYQVCDFRGGAYQGDFVTYNFEYRKFDIIMFISSLEHFPQCTESDLVFREGYDKKAIEKAIGMLNFGGRLVLTVPYGKTFKWQNYHHTYNYQIIDEMFRGMKMRNYFTYYLQNNEWSLEKVKEFPDWHDPSGKVHGVLCAVFEKN